jgi:hypothetical protein
MSYRGDVRLGTTVHLKFSTVNTSAVPTSLSSGTVAAYPDSSTTELTAGITLTVDFDGRTGLHHLAVVATSGNGYLTATNYDLVLTAGTVGGTSVVGMVVGSFSIEARSAVMPTVVGRTLDVSAGGEAGVDWANVGSPTTTTALTNTSIASVSGAVGSVTGAVGSVTGDTKQTGDAFARLGAPAGASVSADLAAVKTDTAGIAAKTVNLPASPASTTNITAGTITTVSGTVTGSVGSVTAPVTVGTNSDKTGYRLSTAGVDDVLDATVDGTVTLRQSQRLSNAAAAGKLSGAATTSVTIRDLADTKNRIVATVDVDGNRTSVTRDVT